MQFQNWINNFFLFWINFNGDILNIEKGDFVTRKSHNNDIIFKVISISEDTVYLKGVYDRLYADSDIFDLVKTDEKPDDFLIELDINNDRTSYFYLPAKILHIDGDNEYLEKCLKFYKANKIYAVGKKINENEIAKQIPILLKEIKPDILVITGHDAYYAKKGNKNDINNYKNSKNFVRAIKQARNYEKSHERLVIIAGACQSDYEDLIKAGANFASSPKRVNIHALDPAIIASTIALTKTDTQINVPELLEKTKYGANGMGGIITNGLMYVGYPRWI